MLECVVGGVGYIGSHLVDVLVKRSTVTIIDKALPSGPVTANYLRRDISCDPFPQWNHKPYDVLYHLAAIPWAKIDNESNWIGQQRKLMKTNIYGTLRLINEIDSKLFVFASTANLYGNGRKLKEDSPFDLSSPYGYSKAVGERIIALSGKRHVIYRFGTVVGHRGRCFPNRLVWCAINGVPVEIFNNGDTYRDLIDIRDLLPALLSSSELEDGIYNLSSGTEIKGGELAELVSNMAEDRGYKLEYSLTDFVAPGYVPYSTLDISKIVDTGVWEPKTSIERTIEHLFDYYMQPNTVVPPRWDKT